eukprot:scaffold909_cov575-Prasinococcus_capsulatus_cf.AAC.3
MVQLSSSATMGKRRLELLPGWLIGYSQLGQAIKRCDEHLPERVPAHICADEQNCDGAVQQGIPRLPHAPFPSRAATRTSHPGGCLVCLFRSVTANGGRASVAARRLPRARGGSFARRTQATMSAPRVRCALP